MKIAPIVIAIAGLHSVIAVGQAASANGNCNIVISGSNNTVSPASLQKGGCWLVNEQLNKIIKLLNATLTKKDAVGINTKLDELIEVAGRGQQTAVNAPITQKNNGGCNQQVVGGNNNTNNCVPLDRTLTSSQEDRLRSAISQVPADIEVVISHSDNRDAQQFAESILSVINPIHRLSHDGGFIGGHWKGNKIAVHGTDDIAATPAQILGFAVDHNGIPLAEPKELMMDPKEVPAGKIYIFIGEQ